MGLEAFLCEHLLFVGLDSLKSLQLSRKVTEMKCRIVIRHMGRRISSKFRIILNYFIRKTTKMVVLSIIPAKVHRIHATILLCQSAQCIWASNLETACSLLFFFSWLIHHFFMRHANPSAQSATSTAIRPFYPVFANSSNRPTFAENMSISPDYFHSNLRGFMGLRTDDEDERIKHI